MKVAVLVLLPIVTLAVQAVPSAPRVPRGDGAMTCRTFVAATARPVVDTQQISWTLGYVAAVEAGGAQLRPVSDVYVRGWIGAYCDRNQSVPTATIEVATRALIDSLRE